MHYQILIKLMNDDQFEAVHALANHNAPIQPYTQTSPHKGGFKK